MITNLEPPTEFDKLNRQAEKMRVAGKGPKNYVKCIADLEDFMNEAIAKQKVTAKKMNKLNAQGLNAVKQRIKKTNKEYQSQIDEYREDKDTYLFESDEEEEPAPKAKKVRIADAFTDEGDDEGFAIVGKGGRALQFTPESIFKHLRTIMESRGKKNTDKQEQIKIMENLNEISNTPYQRIRVLLTLVSTRFDLGSGATTSMPLDHWKSAEKEISQLLSTLDENRDYIVIENAEEWDDDEKPPTLGKDEKYIKVPGSIVSYIERLDDELTRSLQSIDPHTSEYIDRLTDESALYNLIFKSQLYYETLRKDESLEIEQDNINRIVSRRLEHIYFKVGTLFLVMMKLTCANFILSLPKWSRPLRRTHGRQCLRVWTPTLPHESRAVISWISSTPSATTYLPTVRATTGHVPCCATSTFWRCTITTTSPAT